MSLPTASRAYPYKINPSDEKSGEAYAAEVAANSQRLYDLTIGHLGSIGGSANAITAQCSPPLIADPAHGQTFRLKPTAGNTDAVTVAIDGRGPYALRDYAGVALASGALATGVSVELWFDADNGYYRLAQRTLAQAQADLAAAAAAATLWEVIGNTTISSAVAQVEHLFTVARYTKILLLLQGVAGSGLGSAANFVITLRNASTAIVTLQTNSMSGGAGMVRIILAGEADFRLSLGGATKAYFGNLDAYVIADGLSDDFVEAAAVSGTHATAADRLRIVQSTGNLTAGRVISLGLRAP